MSGFSFWASVKAAIASSIFPSIASLTHSFTLVGAANCCATALGSLSIASVSGLRSMSGANFWASVKAVIASETFPSVASLTHSFTLVGAANCCATVLGSLSIASV